ncbi:MAG: alpha/beta fold hydrolase [Thermaceae bacterium]|nr:alpha/beta fold hydrolase [Thermaceae bacterium]
MHIEINGLRLGYDDSGGDKTAFVTLHGGPGMGSRKGDWATFQPLTDTYRLISFDQRGNGESEGAEPYSHEQFVADLEALRQKLGLGKIVLLGGSYGGYIALEYALRYQDNLHALILRDTAGSNRYKDTSKQRALQSGFPMDQDRLDRLFAGQMRSDEDFRQSYAMIQPLYTVRRDPTQEAQRLVEIPFRYQTHNWAFSRNQANFDLTAQLHTIKIPVLVTVGRHDWITPLEASEELHALLPDSELIVFEHSGHSPQLEEHPAYIVALRSFLGRRLS